MSTTHHEDGYARTPKKAALASWIGSVLEYYDFFIYGTAAALVFGKVFFPESDPATGTLLSFATYGVGYVARPIGAFFMGHIGDKYGRKRVLILTVTMMGLSTFLVGCLPSYNSIGLWAPALLVVLRLMQGFSASGEQASANSLTLEHAPEHRRAFFSSFTLSGTQAGLIIATAVYLPIGTLPDDQLLTWGWRIPFWLSAFVVLAGVLIRRRLEETPAFQAEASDDSIPKLPLAMLWADHRADVAARGARGDGLHGEHDLRRLRAQLRGRHKGLDRTTMLWVSIVTNVVALAALPAWAILSDRVGRKQVFIFGAIGSGALMFAYLGAISNGSWPLIFALRRPHVRARLQRHERHPARPLRRDVPDPRAALGHGDRHADRLRDRRLRADRGRRDRGRRAERLGAGRRLRAGLQPDRRRRRRDDARDLQGAARGARAQGGALPADRRAAVAARAHRGRRELGRN